MRASRSGGFATVALTAAVLLAATAIGAHAAKPGPGRPRRHDLFAVPFAVLNVNRVFCAINNTGRICADPSGSAVIAGGFWPKGTPDQYVFQSNLQLAGTIPTIEGLKWSGDTVGLPSGGSALTPVYSSLDPADAVSWPTAGFIWDTTVYDRLLIGRKSISQQDLWLRFWDGDPAFRDSSAGPPMGLLVEERAFGWNYPSGNEDVIYVMFTFFNVTARNTSVYDRLSPGIRDEIAKWGEKFQTLNEARYPDTIPDDGYPITNLYAGFWADMDVGDPSSNYATPVIPFATGVSYQSSFLAPGWAYPPEIFSSPFVPAPGFIGVKLLRTPLDSIGQPVGLTMFSNTTLFTIGGYEDAQSVRQLYRYLSGTSSPAAGDFPCTFQGEQLARHYCFLRAGPADIRFFQSSGPMTLAPGEEKSIVVAYVFAAPTDVVSPYIGGDFSPDLPATGDAIAADPSLVRPIERAMGWMDQEDRDGNGVITQDEVTTLPRSLLGKAQVAQAVYDGKFLLPFAPEGPPFFLIPGDNQVTVVWQKSASEDIRAGGGDPFFATASDPTSTLYDPNFRQYDVEGYRIYRGRTTGDLRLVAQFDYAGTTMTDFSGAFAYLEDADGDGRVRCAPELGVLDDCPVPFPSDTGVAHALAGDIIQVPAGGRVALADLTVLIAEADTAVSGVASGAYPPLMDSGVSFSFVDRGVRNNFDYYYAVTAFDINSLRSGPSSIESPRITRQVTPRTSSGQEKAGRLSTLELFGATDSPLAGQEPALDPATSEFSGPMPPTNGLTLGFATFLPELLGSAGSVSLTIDSVTPDSGPSGIESVYYVRVQGSGAPTALAIPVYQDAFAAPTTAAATFPAVAIDQAHSGRFGDTLSYTLFGTTAVTLPGAWRLTSWGRGSLNGNPPNSGFNGPRWWAGSVNENTSDPNGHHCPGSPGTCVQEDVTRTAGVLPGVDTLFHPLSYNTVPNVPQRDLEALTATVARAADIKVYWGTNGVVDSVIDATHQVAVPFSSRIRASWGILNDSSFALGGAIGAITADGRNNLLTWSDDFCVDPAPRFLNQCGGPGQSPAILMDHAILSPIAAHASTYSGTAALAAGGTGFTFYLNGHFFLMQMATLPAGGTVWTARFYSGTITGSAANGDFAFVPAVRPPAVPGLRARISYTGSTFDLSRTTAANLARVHTVPDPYYVTSALEASSSFKVLRFVNLPAQAIVRIYSVSGVLVAALTHNDPTGGGELTWNLRSRTNQYVASGVYFYHVETPDHQSRIGRFTVVNFAP